MISNYEECVRRKEVVDYEETLNLLAGKRTYHTVLTPIIENGEVQKIIGSSRDITDKKRMEEYILDQKNLLESTINESRMYW